MAWKTFDSTHISLCDGSPIQWVNFPAESRRVAVWVDWHTLDNEMIYS